MNREYLPLVIILLLASFALLLPARWDPIVLLKEWLQKKGGQK